jgi:Domain of unknown function (DUF4292)
LIPLLKRPLVVSFQPLKFLVLALVGFGLASCATVSPPAPELPAPKWESAELIKSMAQRRDQFRSLRAPARVDYAGPDGRHGFQEAVVVQRPDRLRLETLSPLGAVLIVTANDKEIVGYHPREGVFVRGRRSKENLLRYTKIPLELDEITSLLVGLPPVDPSTPWKPDGNTLIFSPDGRKKDALAFESQQPVPTKWERFNTSGAVELSAQFSDYVSTPAGLFPSRIIIEAPSQKRKLEIRYQEPELNGKIPSELFTQQKPPHAQEVPIEAIGN